MSYTNGPWENVGRFNNMTHSIHVNLPTGHIEVSTDNAYADARLIAAAPELVEALELYLEGSMYINGDMEEKIPVLKRARTLGFLAIQKAKGDQS